VKKSGEFDRTNAIKDVRIFPDELAARSKELVLTFRASMIPEIEKAECLGGATAIWSLWSGYLKLPGENRLLEFLRRHEIPLIQHHASGHAYLPDLQRVTRALAAKRVVPIHSFAPQRFAEFFDRVELHDDGEWWDV
jgi:ribonuclease J